MSVEASIEDGARRFHAFYGRRPETVYLGTEHVAELGEIFSRFAYVRDDAMKGLRMRYRGMTVFQVDAPTHIGFGLDLPSPCA